MNIRTSAFIATSLDGFIARLDGAIDWLERANAAVTPGEDCGYKAFIDAVDLLVMGRNSFEKVLTFGEWPYHGKRVVVLSRKGAAIPAALAATVSTSAEAPRGLLDRLAAEGVKHVYVDGGLTIQSFLRGGLLGEITLTRIPVLLGQGLPLFGPLSADVSLEHVETIAYPFGFVQSRYRVTGGGH